MLVVFTAKLSQLLRWLVDVAGYRVAESNYKLLDCSWEENLLLGRNSMNSPGFLDKDVLNKLFNDLSIKDGNSNTVLCLSNFTKSAKEDLRQAVIAINGHDIYLMGIVNEEDVSLGKGKIWNGVNEGTCCQSFHLKKGSLIDNNDKLVSPHDTLSMVACRNSKIRTIYFSRHGESDFNVLGKIGGDANLSPRGRLYAKYLGKYINSSVNKRGFRVWTSRLRRTIQTAQEVHAPQKRFSALNELDAGLCDGMTYEEVAAQYPIEFAARDEDKFRCRYPGGESYEDLLNRVQPVLSQLQFEDNLLVVSHQAVLRCLLAVLLNKDVEELPYIHTPLHTLMRLDFTQFSGCELKFIPFRIDCVDTHRAKPQNCSVTRSSEEALVTVPTHF